MGCVIGVWKKRQIHKKPQGDPGVFGREWDFFFLSQKGDGLETIFLDRLLVGRATGKVRQRAKRCVASEILLDLFEFLTIPKFPFGDFGRNISLLIHVYTPLLVFFFIHTSHPLWPDEKKMSLTISIWYYLSNHFSLIFEERMKKTRQRRVFCWVVGYSLFGISFASAMISLPLKCSVSGYFFL